MRITHSQRLLVALLSIYTENNKHREINVAPYNVHYNIIQQEFVSAIKKKKWHELLET